MTKECEPGWTVRTWPWFAVPRQHAPHQVLVYLDVKDLGDLIGNTLVTEVRVFVLHLDDERDQFGRGPFGARLAARFRCEEQAVFPFD